MSEATNELRRGWRTLLAAALGVGAGLTGLPFYTFGVFIKPLGDAFGWTRSEVTFGMLCLSAGTVLTGPFIGSVIDRRGVRKVALTSLVGLAIGFFALAGSGASLASYYGAWLLLAFLGCATTPLTWTRAVAARFDKTRGLALGLVLMGTGVAGILGPTLVGAAIARWDWSAGYMVMGAFVAFVVLPAAAFGLKDDPAAATAPSARAGLTLREALATGRFWIIASSIFLMILGQASATVHLVPLLSDRGVPAVVAASVAGLLGVSIIIGRVVVGLLVDRLHAPRVAAFFFTLPALALLLLLWRSDVATARLAAILLGLAAGAEVDLLAYLVSRYFGLRAYGAIYGLQLSIFGVGAGLGPLLTGLVHDHHQSYAPALVGGTIIFLAGAAIASRLGPYPSFEPAKG